MKVGKKILIEGGSALDAVEKTINRMEDNPLFNAGKGAVFTHSMPCNTDGMFRGYATAEGKGGVFIYKDEK